MSSEDFDFDDKKKCKKKKANIKKSLYCGNCGKGGHLYRNCTEPITSFGLVNVKIDGADEMR